MTEKSFLLPGSTVGDGALAPMDSADLADWLYFAFEWYPATDIGHPSYYSSSRADIYALPIDGTTIPVRGAVISGVNSMLITETALIGSDLLVSCSGGYMLADGRLYYMDTGTGVTLTMPGAGTRYYAVGVEVNSTAQTARFIATGNVTTIAGITKLFDSRRKSSSYFCCLNIIKLVGPSTRTYYDTRRIIRPHDISTVRVVARQGGSATDWSAAGNNNYTLTGNVGLVPFQVEGDVASGDSVYPVSGFPNNPVAIANAVGPNYKAFATVCPVADRGNTEVYVVERDGGILNPVIAHGLIFGDRTIDQLAQSGYTPIYATVDNGYNDYDIADTSW